MRTALRSPAADCERCVIPARVALPSLPPRAPFYSAGPRALLPCAREASLLLAREQYAGRPTSEPRELETLLPFITHLDVLYPSAIGRQSTSYRITVRE